MTIVSSKKRRGTALLEAVIAIGVILVGVVGSLVLLTTSINLGRANQDRIVAQNLSREGIELAYSLRNSGAMRKVDDPTVNWSSFLFNPVLKSNDPGTFCNRYNLGDIVTSGGNRACMQIGAVNDPANYLTTEDDDQGGLCGGPADNTNTEIEELNCDIFAIVGWMFDQWPQMPSRCSPDPALPPPSNYPPGCNYDGQGNVDISDLTRFISDIYLASYQFGYGYPTFSSASGYTDAQFTFNNPYVGNFTVTANSPPTPNTAQYTSLNPIWQDARARVYTNSTSTSYIQNMDQPNKVATKYYRVVSMQPICRGTKAGATVEAVVDPMSGYNCQDYIVNNPGFGWAGGVSTVGVLVTSEVRWPTPLSNTKVRYQEFLYDWIVL